LQNKRSRRERKESLDVCYRADRDVDCAMYVMSNKKGVVIYVGVSIRPFRRIYQHARKPKTIEFEAVDIKIQWYGSIKDAHAEELKLIHKLKPKYNKRSNLHKP